MDVMLLRFRAAYWLWLGVLLLGGATGCVERRMIITTDPYGAVIYDEKNHPIGAAPVDRSFTFYGIYKFRLAKDGYETLDVQENVSAPWFEYFGLDFISENLLPFTIRDVRHFNYPMRPLQVVPPELLLQKAQELRDYGQTKGEAPVPSVVHPPAPTPAPVVAPPVTMPAPTPLPASPLPPTGPPPAPAPIPSVVPPTGTPTWSPVPPVPGMLPPPTNLPSPPMPPVP
jgi:hypothetical protein